MEIKIPQELLDRAARWPDLKRWERKELGQQLRAVELSYREIRELIPVPRGTLSGWCRDINLSDDQEARLKSLNHSALSHMKKGAKIRKANLARIAGIRAAARQEAEGLANDSLWMAGVIAYWAEGSKQASLELSNSDPGLIVLFMR